MYLFVSYLYQYIYIYDICLDTCLVQASEAKIADFINSLGCDFLCKVGKLETEYCLLLVKMHALDTHPEFPKTYERSNSS